MKLNAIFVGQPKTITINGKQISTSIFKDYVSGAVKVNPLNIEGDAQADLRVHGGIDKAVYAYPAEHYNFWTNKRPDLNFEAGTFGENLSITGLTEDVVCVGDQYQIGTVIFEVTTPRLPCFKLGIKMGDATIIKEFMDAEKSGWYFKPEFDY